MFKISALLVVLTSVVLVRGTETSVALSDNEITFGEALIINVSVAIGNETVDKPVLEIHLPPRLQFSKATVLSSTRDPAGGYIADSLIYKVGDGELMGKFSLGDKIIKATRSFAITAGNESSWPEGFVYRGVMRLENVSSTSLDENRQFAICVFRYWKTNGDKGNAEVLAQRQRSSGKYFFLHPLNVSVRAIGDQGVGKDGATYRISSQKPLRIILTADIDPRAGNVVLKLTIPGQLIIEEPGYGLGSSRNTTDAAVMQLRNQTAGTVALYVLITPSMLEASGDNAAFLSVSLRARGDQLTSASRILGSVLYGSSFQHHADARATNVSMEGSTSGVQREDNGPKLPPRTVIEYAPRELATRPAGPTLPPRIMVEYAPRSAPGGPLLDTGQKQTSSNLTSTAAGAAKVLLDEVNGDSDKRNSSAMTTSVAPMTQSNSSLKENTVQVPLTPVTPIPNAGLSSAQMVRSAIAAGNVMAPSVSKVAMATNGTAATTNATSARAVPTGAWSNANATIWKLNATYFVITRVIAAPNTSAALADAIPKPSANATGSLADFSDTALPSGDDADMNSTHCASDSTKTPSSRSYEEMSATLLGSEFPGVTLSPTAAVLIESKGQVTAEQDEEADFNSTAEAPEHAADESSLAKSADSAKSLAATEPCGPEWWSVSILLSDCYYFPNQTLPYTEAEEECTSRGGHLASLRSIYDRLALSTFWKNKSKATEVWIGLSRSATQDFWKWADGSKVGYVNWCDSYPTVGSKHCAVSSAATGDNYCWKNRVCDLPLDFFCSKPRGETSSTVYI